MCSVNSILTEFCTHCGEDLDYGALSPTKPKLEKSGLAES